MQTRHFKLFFSFILVGMLDGMKIVKGAAAGTSDISVLSLIVGFLAFLADDIARTML